MTDRITLLTPTYARDYERFCLQRESIERCGIDLPHVAIVHHEDLELFRKMPFQKRLTILSARDVLPASYDRRRQVWGYSRRDYRYWITGRGIHGWLLQQLVKLASPAIIQTEGIVCVDSDMIFMRPLNESDFIADDGRLHLYETTDDVDVEMAEWYAHSLRFFGLSPTGVPVRRYTHVPAPVHRGVLLDMQRKIEEVHGKFWVDAIIEADRIMEYTTYGVYARHVDDLKRVAPATPSLTLYYWWATEAASLESSFVHRLVNSDAKMALIHSNIGRPVESYRNLIEQAWAQLQLPA